MIPFQKERQNNYDGVTSLESVSIREYERAMDDNVTCRSSLDLLWVNVCFTVGFLYSESSLQRENLFLKMLPLK